MQDCAAWYAEIDEPVGSPIQQQNESHQHFIGVLEQVKDRLQPNVEAAVDCDTDVSPSTEDDIAIEIIFSLLELEEPSESPLGTEPAPNQPRVTFKFEASEEEEKTVSEGSSSNRYLFTNATPPSSQYGAFYKICMKFAKTSKRCG